MSTHYDPSLILVVGMQALDVLLLLTTGHQSAGLNDTMQHVLRTVKSALNIGLRSPAKSSQLQAAVLGKALWTTSLTPCLEYTGG